MLKVSAKDFGIRCVSTFATPKPYDEAFLGKFVSAALQEFASYGIGATNFAKNEGDRLFGYLVSFSLFNGNATFVLGGSSLIINILNGQNERDAELIKDLLNRAHRCLPELEKTKHLLNGFCHAEFVEEGNVEQIFQGLVKLSGSVKLVSASVLSDDPKDAVPPPKERIRLDIAPSDFRENRLFMSWNFFGQGALSEDYWKALVPRLNALAGSIGIEVV